MAVPCGGPTASLKLVVVHELVDTAEQARLLEVGVVHQVRERPGTLPGGATDRHEATDDLHAAVAEAR